MRPIKDLTNQTFESGITALEFVEIKNHAAYWKCKCHCGNIFITRGADLTNGHTKSCGCINKKRMTELGKNNTHSKIDLTGQRFGKLVVLEDTGKRDSGRCVIWKCQCDCGNICEISSHSLKGGTQSCGCLSSKGELKIGQVLQQENIKYISQYSFQNCIFEETNRQARFDFYIPEKNILIEFDGIQHLDIRYGWNTKENFSNTFMHDQIKNQYCLEHGILLYRIPYYDLNKINILEDILQDKYLVKNINHYNINIK